MADQNSTIALLHSSTLLATGRCHKSLSVYIDNRMGRYFYKYIVIPYGKLNMVLRRYHVEAVLAPLVGLGIIQAGKLGLAW